MCKRSPLQRNFPKIDVHYVSMSIVSGSQLGSVANKTDHPVWPTSNEFRAYTVGKITDVAEDLQVIRNVY